MKLRRSIIILAVLSLATLPVHADLIAFYSFDDEGDPLVDDSGGGNNLTIAAGTDPVWGAMTGFRETGAYDYSADRLIAPIDVNSGVMPQMTWGAWVRTDALDSGLRKVLGHDNGAWDRTLGLDNRAPDGAFRYSAFTGDDAVNASGPVEGTPAPVSTTDWTFLAASHDQVSKTITVYVDLDASTTEDAVLSFTEPAGFGAGFNTFAIGGIRPDNANEPWDGAIDNVFVYDEVLDAGRLTAIRDGGKDEILGGAPDPNLSVVTPSPIFGELTALGAGPGPIMRTITIRNTGETKDLTISAVGVAGGDAGFYTHDAVPPIVISPMTEGDIIVTLTPPAAGGSLAAALEITSDDADSPLVTIPLDAVIASDPNIEIGSGDPLFGVINGPVPQTRALVVRNTGVAATLNISDVRLAGVSIANYTLGVVPPAILPGEEFGIDVTFNDGGTVGSYPASVEIDSDDADTPMLTVALDARSVMPTPAGSLIAFYPVDDANNPFVDASGESGDLVNGGGAPSFDETGGFEGGCFQFGGMDWLNAPIDINPLVMPHMTMGAWVRTDSLVTGLRKVMGHDDGGWDRGLGLDNRSVAAGGPQPPTFRYTAFTGTDNAGPIQFTPEPVSTEDYTFLAVSYDETNFIASIYVDLDASTTDDPLVKRSSDAPSVPSVNTSLAVGALRPDTGTEGWVGCIDNVFVFDGVLSDAEVKSLRDLGKAAFVGADNFRITSIVRNPDNTVTLIWNSSPVEGTTYTVRFSTDLKGLIASWADDADDVATGGEITTHTTGNTFPQGRVFFVVQEN